MPVFSRPDIDLAFLDEGQGEPIMLVHGFASSAEVNWVGPGWVDALVRSGRRVIAFDHRGHGASTKFHARERYRMAEFAGDVLALAEHCGIGRFDLMGYSMGARVGVFVAMTAPERLRSLVIGGLGIHLVEQRGLPMGIAEALETPHPEALTDANQRLFRRFAEANGGDLVALAACIRGSREAPRAEALARITAPTLIATGSRDRIAGDPQALAALIPGATTFVIEGKDHNPAVGDRTFREAVLAFLAARP
jgi:pimeloyl-ACP methyl ester carboxylesterase